MATAYISGQDNERELVRATEGSEPGLGKRDKEKMEERDKNVAIDEENGVVDEVTGAVSDTAADGDAFEVATELATDDDEGNDQVDLATDSETEATLVGDGGSFALWHTRPSFEKETSFVVEPRDDVLAAVHPKGAVGAGDNKLNDKPDGALDRVLVSLSLCVCSAATVLVPQLLLIPSGVHWSRWVVLLVLLVWIPIVH